MEKKTEKILLIASAIICAIVLISAGWIFFSPLFDNGAEIPYEPVLQFHRNESAGTLTVAELHYLNINWEDFEITGNATAPTGPIKVGDVINNCTGTITISYPATKTLMGVWTFNQ